MWIYLMIGAVVALFSMYTHKAFKRGDRSPRKAVSVFGFSIFAICVIASIFSVLKL